MAGREVGGECRRGGAVGASAAVNVVEVGRVGVTPRRVGRYKPIGLPADGVADVVQSKAALGDRGIATALRARYRWNASDEVRQDAEKVHGSSAVAPRR